ncbi:ribosomal oxygenase 1 [Procambarus clarkii]|uniref:ribosomal oxygenase 1 n=1 Tax=Procambarus clarkii TaxID=6728 RepID=UPI001E67159D|nr:ribosomal oxygenase 1-like [Procambarus clarkii]XP_045617937.1 ribosomal oxygenase 1-like [Procambarus clarkii]
MKVANVKQSARAAYMEQALQMKKNKQKFKRQPKVRKGSDKSQKKKEVNVPSPTLDMNTNNALVNKKPKLKSKVSKTLLEQKGKSLKAKNKQLAENLVKKKKNSPKKVNTDNLKKQLNGFAPLTNDTTSFTNKTESLKGKTNTPEKANVDSLKKQSNGLASLTNDTTSFPNETEILKTAKKRKQNTEGEVLEKKIKKKKKANPKKKMMLIAAVKEALHAECSGEDPEEDSVTIEPLSGAEIGAVNIDDSNEEGLKAFQWVIGPCSEEKFFRDYWEKKPLHIKRSDAQYYKGLFSTDVLDNILRENMVLYTKNLDITSFSNGKRETHNPIGQAHPPVVWDYYNNGCSVRMLNPQTFHRPVWKLLSVLQEYFKSFCGANVYLTPPDTQGFAPHWDDIEAFILQLEGKKRWRVYKPRSENEELPVNSSPNLSEDEIGEPVLDIVLEEGDLLYFPRGYIHQGITVDNTHSLHITISTYQKNTWGHLLKKLLPQALSVAMNDDIEFRRGLPRDYLDSMGIVNMDKDSPSRSAFIEKLGELVTRLMEMAPVDAAVDQRGASFMHDALPPLLSQDERECSVYGGGERWCKKTKEVKNRVEIEPDTPIRLIRKNCLRVVAEEENVNVYHCLENTREYHQEQPQFIELAPETAPAIEALIHAYPKYITVECLPLNDETEKMAVASGLWERGLVVTATPLNAPHDD